MNCLSNEHVTLFSVTSSRIVLTCYFFSLSKLENEGLGAYMQCISLVEMALTMMCGKRQHCDF